VNSKPSDHTDPLEHLAADAVKGCACGKHPSGDKNRVAERRIIHVDMDEFFAAVEKLDHPELRGKPILVGGRPADRGVVCTASYEARKFGCHSAMPMGQAMRLCPQAVVLPVRGERYEQVSGQVLEILCQFTPLVEPVSIDEAFLDVTGCEGLFGPAETMGRTIQSRIRGEIGLTASVGVAPNKFLAKLASDLRKPNGFLVIREANVHELLDPLPVTKLWGVGPASAEQLHQLGIETIGQVRRIGPETLRKTLGEAGEHYCRLANGEDDSPVVSESDPKSIGRERTFPQDLSSLAELEQVLLEEVQDVARRLQDHGLLARTVTLKLRFRDFMTITRSQTLAGPTDVTQELWQAAKKLLRKARAEGVRPLRLLGMHVSQLEGHVGQQLSLFRDPQRSKSEAVDRTVNRIIGRFGADAIRRAGTRKK